MENLASFFRPWNQNDSLSVDFSGTWINELGSEMTLEVDPTGKITGTYRPEENKGACESEYQLSGFVNRNLISFVVDFQQSHMITSWTGYALKDGQKIRIKTLWQLVRNTEANELPLDTWGAVYTGSNSFERKS